MLGYPHRGDGQIWGDSHVDGNVPVDVAVGESDCGVVHNHYTPTLHNTRAGPSVFDTIVSISKIRNASPE